MAFISALCFFLTAQPGLAPKNLQSVPIVAASAFSDGRMSQPMADWLASLRQNEPRQKPASRWRALVLIYPNLDTKYMKANREVTRHTARADPALTETIRSSIAELPAIVRRLTGGACELQVDIHVIDRPVTLNNDGTLEAGHSFPAPEDEDIKPEFEMYNKPGMYDSYGYFYNPGDLPQSLAGGGGGGRNGTRFVANFGDLNRWKKTPDFIGGFMSWGQGLFLHEWCHGLDGFYKHSGYQIMDLHHLYRYGRMGHRDKPMYVAHFQGLLTFLDSGRYGFSRSVWLSGSPRNPVELIPCQLTAPMPGVVLGTAGFCLEWARTPAPDGYVVTLRAEGLSDGTPLEFRTRENRIQIPKGGIAPGNYRWHVQALKGDKRSEVGDTFTLTIKSPNELTPPSVTAVAFSQPVAPGNGGMVRLWARVTSEAGVKVAYADYLQADGTHERVRLQRRSGWAADNRWSAMLWVQPNRTRRAQNLSVVLHVEDNAGMTFDSNPIALTVAAPMDQGVASASWVNPGDRIDAVNDGRLPTDSNDHSIPRFTWYNHKGTMEWVQMEYKAPQTVDSCLVYWFQDTGACRVPQAWRLLYRANEGSPWLEVKVQDAPSIRANSWNIMRFAPVSARQFRIEAQLRPGFSAGLLEWQLHNLSSESSGQVDVTARKSSISTEFVAPGQHWRQSRHEVFAPFADFDALHVRVHSANGKTRSETSEYDGGTWAEVRWPDGQVQHLAFNDANMQDGGYVPRTEKPEFGGAATAWVPRLNPAHRDYEVKFFYRHPDGTVSESPVYPRVFVPDFVKPVPKAKATASSGPPADPANSVIDGLLPSRSFDHAIPRFTWWDQKGTKEWIQLDYETLQSVDSCYVYWFQDSGGCRTPESWKLLYREDEKSAWREVATRGPLGTEIDRWNTVRFAPVKAKQFRIEAKLKPGFSGGILEWRLF
ncbi:MAG: discoidin domain-containing protein [Methanoregulaceae archaeon]|nr:discoidin domain-containing protein [Methanoregulaceae archaeon]